MEELSKDILKNNIEDLVNNTILFEYTLDKSDGSIKKTKHTHQDILDYCFSSKEENLSQLMFDSIVEYSYSEFRIQKDQDYNQTQKNAFVEQIKWDSESLEDDARLKHGIYGDILLFLILTYKFKARKIISRGYFYLSHQNSEPKGFDAYHFIQNKDSDIELWFGEAKMYKNLSFVKELIEKFPITLSDNYLNREFLTIDKFSDSKHLEIKNTKINDFLSNWNDRTNNSTLLSFLKENNISLIHPVFICYNKNNMDLNLLDNSIKRIIEKINQYNHSAQMSIDFKIFFIFLPLDNVTKVKQEFINLWKTIS